ncbi:GNAT family N-acetyltransferase [Acetanaerobacterium elongatum]|uniref:Phosphinothricin acetyltransferase n=1 Tax=Acetanaerobacterium elongatum TaxID=258515 RepID=A0A1H0AZN9_9FIRM|nr:GNAT family N-acetyltransferase [Acetanaerobacterium elongatum]SDN38839.1 phosphinothricin acetyltransferase [Acetanaerobacterium elongatum]
METISFEKVSDETLPEVLEIYTYYVLNTTATFHAHALTKAEMKEIVIFESPKYCTYVIRQNNTIAGYVILTQHKKREAYDATAEVTIYLKPGLTGKGIGSKAIEFIQEKAKEQKMHVLVATICGENRPSIRLFEKNGFTKCAHYKEVGIKFGQYLDVVAYQKII